MNKDRESRWTDVMCIVLGLLTPLIGISVTQNSFVYPAGDPRGDPGYAAMMIWGSVVTGVIVFGAGLIRLIQSYRDGA